jgi:hypothetical protein
MNKEVKPKGDVMEKKRVGPFAAAVLSLFVLSSAAPARPASPPPGGCDNAGLCLQQIEQKIRNLRAYVRFLKPGDPVELTKEPHESSPQYRQGFEAFSSLRELFASLAQSSPWGGSKPWPQRDADAWRSYLSDAQAKLERLGQASSRNAASAALGSLSASEQRLSRHYRRRKAVDGY